LWAKEELRAMTNSERKRDSSVMMSSVMPSLKYSCSGSPVPRVRDHLRFTITQSDAKGAQGLGDILEALLAEILERQIELRLYVLVNHGGQADAPRIGQIFEAGSNIYAISVYIVAFDDHITEVNADTKFDAQRLWDFRISRGHLSLNIDSAFHGVYDAGELGQCAVAHQLDDAAMVRGDLGINELSAVDLEALERAGLILAHETRIARHVGDKNGGKPAFHVFVMPRAD
jgi:hypothetical protein